MTKQERKKLKEQLKIELKKYPANKATRKTTLKLLLFLYKFGFEEIYHSPNMGEIGSVGKGKKMEISISCENEEGRLEFDVLEEFTDVTNVPYEEDGVMLQRTERSAFIDFYYYRDEGQSIEEMELRLDELLDMRKLPSIAPRK